MNSNHILWTIGMVLASITSGSGQSVVQVTTNNYAVPEWAGSVTLSVVRLKDLTSEVSVDYGTADGTATAGMNYTATNGALTFAASETNKSIVVPILNDGFVESLQTFTVALTHPSNAVLGAPVTATVSIRDTDLGVVFQFPSYQPSTHWIWTEDIGVVRIGVVRGDDADIPVTVDFATSDLTATNGVDYIGLTNALSFAPTERLKFVPVTILNNTHKQTNRTFRATLSNPVGVSLGTTKSTTVMIVDNDQGFQFETNKYDVAEDAGVVMISVLRGTDDTNSTVTVDWATTDQSAIGGQDYTSGAGTLSFLPGERHKLVAVPILNDGIRESTKTFQVMLNHPTGGAVVGAPATVTVSIRDNDPGVGFEVAAFTNAWNPSGDLSVRVLRGNDGTLSPISVDYATGDNTAKAGVDYEAVSGRLEFQENQTVKSLAIPLLPGKGSGKSFRVKLSNPSPGVTLGAASTTVTIGGRYVTVAPPFDTALTIRREGEVNRITWVGGGQLQRADKPAGPWQTLTNATSPCTVQSPVPTTFYRVTRPRLAKLYVPSSYTGQTNMPLVIMLHGYFGSSDDYDDLWQIPPLAEVRGFLYGRPEGLKDRFGYWFWNGTDAFADFYNTGVDDAGYLRMLIEEIGRRFAVDPKRVHLFGIFMGGFMAYRVACESADLIAGIVSISGTTFLDPSRCQPSEPVNILHIHGTAEDAFFYLGSAVNPSVYGVPANMPPYPGAMQTIQSWAAYNGARDPVTDPAPSMDLVLPLREKDTVVTRYRSSPPGGAVELWSILGGGHFSTDTDEYSSRLIDWLLAHPKP